MKRIGERFGPALWLLDASPMPVMFEVAGAAIPKVAGGGVGIVGPPESGRAGRAGKSRGLSVDGDGIDGDGIDGDGVDGDGIDGDGIDGADGTAGADAVGVAGTAASGCDGSGIVWGWGSGWGRCAGCGCAADAEMAAVLGSLPGSVGTVKGCVPLGVATSGTGGASGGGALNGVVNTV